MPKWKVGRPDAAGTWVVETVTKDVVVVKVEVDAASDCDEGVLAYLRADMDGFSEPLDDPESEVYQLSAWSYGPIPERSA